MKRQLSLVALLHGILLVGVWFVSQSYIGSAYVIWQAATVTLAVVWWHSSSGWRKLLLGLLGVAFLPVIPLIYYAEAGFLLLGVAALGIVATLVAALLLGGMRLLGVSVNGRWVVVPLLLVTTGLGAPLTGALAAPSAVPSDDLSSEEQMEHLYYTDQYDRIYGFFFLMLNRDYQRLERLHELRDAGVIDTPKEKYFAAWVLQHGICTENVAIAHEYASAIRDADIANVPSSEIKFIYQATYDRWQQKMGNEQKYGTQGTVGGEGQTSCYSDLVPPEIAPTRS